MAQEKQEQKPVDTEKYKGPGRISSAVTGFSFGAGVGGALMVGLGAIGSIADKLDDFIRSSRQGVNTRIALVAGAFSIIPAIIGGWMGFAGADKGRKQFEAAKAERDEARGQLGQAAAMIQGLEAERGALHAEVGEHRKRFTEGLKSHAEHGSHAGAHEASKAAAAHAEHGV